MLNQSVIRINRWIPQIKLSQYSIIYYWPQKEIRAELQTYTIRPHIIRNGLSVRICYVVEHVGVPGRVGSSAPKVYTEAEWEIRGSSPTGRRKCQSFFRPIR